MYALVIGRGGKPMIYKDFHEAKEKAAAGDRIILTHADKSEEYIVPDYSKMEELEEEIKKLGKFTYARRTLTLKLARMNGEALRFEERSKRNG